MRGAWGTGASPVAARPAISRSRDATSASPAPPTTSAPRSGARGSCTGGDAASIPGTRAARGRCLPGTCSSSTMWKLVPPKPNALTPERRMDPPFVPGFSHARSSVFTRKGEREKSMFGFGAWKLRLGGSIPWCRARVALSTPAAPAPPFRCPMFDLTEPRAIEAVGRPAPRKASCIVSTSTTSPTLVDVPWPSTRSPGAGDSPARAQARVIANFCPAGLGAVMPFPLPSLDPPIPRITA